MICKFSGNVWPNPGFDIIVLLPKAFIRIWSSGGRQKSSFDIQEASHMGHCRKNRFRVSRAAFSRLLRTLCQASPLKTDLGGEICLEPRRDTT